MLLGYLLPCPARTSRNQSIFISPESIKAAQDVVIFGKPQITRGGGRLVRTLPSLPQEFISIHCLDIWRQATTAQCGTMGSFCAITASLRVPKTSA